MPEALQTTANKVDALKDALVKQIKASDPNDVGPQTLHIALLAVDLSADLLKSVFEIKQMIDGAEAAGALGRNTA